MGKSRDKTPRFEDAIAELESIIEKIESGEVGLEESLAYYEKGSTLIRQCKAILSAAEQRIADLTAKVKAADGAEDAEDDEGGEETEIPPEAEADMDAGE